MRDRLISYLKISIPFVITLFAIFWFLTFDRYPQKKRDSKETFMEYCLKHGVFVSEVLMDSFKYNLFSSDEVFFIGEKNGVKDLFSAKVRFYSDGTILNIDELSIKSNTPMAEEKNLQITSLGLFFETYFEDRLTIHFIDKKKSMHHFTFKKIGLMEYKIDNNFIITKEFTINLFDIDLNSPFFYYKKSDIPEFKTDLKNIDFNQIFYISTRKEMKTDIFLKFNQNGKINNILSIEERYIKTVQNLFKNSIELFYYEVEIPNRDYLKLFVFNKKDYFIDFIDSGGYQYSKTGEIFSKKIEKNSILMEIPNLRGGKMGNSTIKPISNNSATIVVTPKNQILYSMDNELTDFQYIQFDYPLIDKNSQNVARENIKINLIPENQKKRFYSGICFKNDFILSFWGDLTRGALIDYLYLLGCDYAFETGGGEINFLEDTLFLNNNSVPKLSLYPKYSKLSEIKNYKINDNEIFESYRYLCSDISINYRKGIYDPMSNNIRSSVASSVVSNLPQNSFYIGATDPIFPDGLFFNNTTYYKPLDKDSFFIDEFTCGVGKLDGKAQFFKEGFIIRKNGVSIIPNDEKYQNVVLVIAKNNYWITFYQFKKATSIKDIISLLEQNGVSDAIVFENSGNLFPLNSLPKMEVIISKDREIRVLK